MARVQGPLMSIGASGTIAGTLTYSTWKGRPYCRQCVIPLNPKSAKQTGVRSMLGWLAQIWASLTTGNKATWDDLAEQKQISTFNAFVSECLTRWQNVKTPTKEYPAAEASTPLTVTTQTLTGGVGCVTVQVTPSGATAAWGVLIFRDTVEITAPTWMNCVGVIDADGANPVTFVDTPLEPGTYHYRTAVFNTDGILGTVKADGTAIVT